MVTPKSQFLVDTAFIIERTHKTFFGTPLLTVEGKDHTFAFGLLRDFLRLRRKLGIMMGVLIIGKESASLASDQNIEDITTILDGLKIPYIHDPVNMNLNIIGRICSRFSHVVTGDKRLLQLSCDNLTIALAQKGQQGEYEWMSPESIKSVMGINPADVPTFLALTEASGAEGLTSRQVLRLIELYGNLDQIYTSMSKVTSFQIQKKLLGFETQVRQYYTESKTGLIPESPLSNMQNPTLSNLDNKNNRRFLGTYGFHSLVTLLGNPSDVRLELNESKSRPDSYHAVIDSKGIQELDSLVRSSKVCAIDTESDSKDPREGTLFGVAFSVKEGEAYFVPLIENDLKGISKDFVLNFLKRLLDSNVDFIGHNIKYDYLLLRRNDITLKSVHFDTMLAAYDCHGDWGFFNLGYLTQKFLGKEIKSYSDLVDEGRTFLDLPFKEMVNHACQDVDMTMRLYPILMNELQARSLTEQYHSNAMQQLKRFGDLEFQGIPVNVPRINTIRESLVKQAASLKNNICKNVGKVFDLDSEKELLSVLRQALDLWGYGGSRRISLSMLEQLAISNPTVRLIVEYRRLRGQITGLDSISASAANGKIHPLFNQIKSRAGLVSTAKPSLFDIDGLPELKSCFDGIVHDYFKDKQRSLDILGHVTQDPILEKVLASKSRGDPFMANHPLMKDLDHTKLLLCLAMNQSESRLSRTFLIDRLKVATIRHDLEKRYQTMFRWLDIYRRQARSKGFAAIDGKRKYIDGLKSSDIAKRGQALEHAVRWFIRY